MLALYLFAALSAILQVALYAQFGLNFTERLVEVRAANGISTPHNLEGFPRWLLAALTLAVLTVGSILAVLYSVVAWRTARRSLNA